MKETDEIKDLWLHAKHLYPFIHFKITLKQIKKSSYFFFFFKSSDLKTLDSWSPIFSSYLALKYFFPEKVVYFYIKFYDSCMFLYTDVWSIKNARILMTKFYILWIILPQMFYVRINILRDFHFCISVSLKVNNQR